MRKKQSKVFGVFLLAVSVACCITACGSDSGGGSGGDTGGRAELMEQEGSYAAYLQQHKDISFGGQEITLTAEDGSFRAGSQVRLLEGYEGTAGKALLIPEGESSEWQMDIPETGLYQIDLTYLGYEGHGLALESSLYIDGELPFDEAQYMTFQRLWKNVKAEPAIDINGNDIRPSQEEIREWQTKTLSDASGYYEEPFSFYLEKGTHTLELVSEREPMLVSELTLHKKETVPSYEEKKAQYEQMGLKEAKGQTLIIQAEDMQSASEKFNYPVNDRSSGYTQPQEADKILLNSIGGSKWQSAGSFVNWKVKVEESGLYRIALRFKQDTQSGTFTTRRLTIDGELPFQEASDLKFYYNSGWECQALGNGTEDYLFYLEAGKEYELRMEAALGENAEVIRRVEGVVEELNAAYRDILMITGASPDKYRDYSFQTVIPETLELLEREADEMADILKVMETMSGSSGEHMSQLTKMEYITRRMTEDPDEIPGKFTTFKDNIAALGTWTIESAQQPLELDYIALLPEGEDVPKAEGNFFEKMAFQAKIFAASFSLKYSEMGVTQESSGGEDSITVWLSTGRDQMNTIRTLINSDFTKNTGITVNLELVNAGTLLPSVLAGKGPDVALSNAVGDPMNYALRNAVLDLSEFDDLDEVTKRFNPSAMMPYQYKGATWAIPETESFNMLFYRTDIFEELGITVPKTWDEWNQVIRELQKKNMSIGLPHDLNMLVTLMYQMNTELYNNEGETVNLDSGEASLAFERLTDYYNLYDFPKDYDFVNRFRSGEMPMAIVDYTIYNQLSLFAPEIKGNWEMTLVPGTVQEDGSVNRTITSTGTAAVILRETKHKDEAWEFLKWWTSTDVQAAYCNEMESAINASAKQPTANKEALAQLQWRAEDLDSLTKEWSYVKGVPEVPGGYYTSRMVTFAFNVVIKDKDNAVDTLQQYIPSINGELQRKRSEFGITE